MYAEVNLEEKNKAEKTSFSANLVQRQPPSRSSESKVTRPQSQRNEVIKEDNSEAPAKSEPPKVFQFQNLFISFRRKEVEQVGNHQLQ